jgi:hypothetical protein
VLDGVESEGSCWLVSRVGEAQLQGGTKPPAAHETALSIAWLVPPSGLCGCFLLLFWGHRWLALSERARVAIGNRKHMELIASKQGGALSVW